MLRLFLALILASPTVCAAAQPRLVELSRLVLTDPDPRFGGLSGIELDADGTRIAMVGDKGILVTGRLKRQGDRITGAELHIADLHDKHGKVLKGGFLADAEGLAFDGQGGFLVSFEGLHRIKRYAAPDAPSRNGPRCPQFRRLQKNSGLEALARAPDGTVYAIPERSGRWKRPFPVYRMRGRRCDARLRIPRRGTFLVTGADFGPDGMLYIVERSFQLIGFATRIRRFAVRGNRIADEEVLMETGHGAIGNLEGIAVWRDPAGSIRLTLVSDDNFSFFQRTLLIEFRVDDAPRLRPRPRPSRSTAD